VCCVQGYRASNAYIVTQMPLPHTVIDLWRMVYVCCVQGYRASNAYIVTQMPLPHTVIDLWRMVYEHKCGTIVMLNPWDEADTVRHSLPAYSPFSQISHSVKG